MIRLLSLIAVLALAACAGTPPPPDWKMNAQSGLDNFQKHYLDGNGKLADLNFAKARAEAARTGRPDLIARIELARCGVRAAALEFDDCPGYLSVADSAAAPERAYADFLAGRWQGLDAKALPAQYAGLLSDADGSKLAEIKEPASRLIAAALLFKSGKLGPAGLATAVATASDQGWRRPLLAWLGIELARARGAGDQAAIGLLQQRIDLVSGSIH